MSVTDVRALDHSALLELLETLSSTDENDLMRRALGTILQSLVDAEASAFIGAQRHERTDGRTTQRNGTRDKTGLPPTAQIPFR